MRLRPFPRSLLVIAHLWKKQHWPMLLLRVRPAVQHALPHLFPHTGTLWWCHGQKCEYALFLIIAPLHAKQDARWCCSLPLRRVFVFDMKGIPMLSPHTARSACVGFAALDGKPGTGTSSILELRCNMTQLPIPLWAQLCPREFMLTAPISRNLLPLP